MQKRDSLLRNVLQLLAILAFSSFSPIIGHTQVSFVMEQVFQPVY